LYLTAYISIIGVGVSAVPGENHRPAESH